MQPLKPKKLKPLTLTQSLVLSTFKKIVDAKGIAPTHKEVAKKLGMARPTVSVHMAAIERKGWIKKSRAWRSVEFLRWPPIMPTETEAKPAKEEELEEWLIS